jgi:hypothetical protein
MPDHRGYLYEVKDISGHFRGTVWPPEAQRGSAGLIVIRYAPTVAAAERFVKNWIDGQLGKQGGG